MMENPLTTIGIAAATITSVTGLIVWLVKYSFKRQGEITDRYFGHLEKRDEQNQQTIERFGGTIDKVNQNLDEHARLLRSISDRQDRYFGHLEKRDEQNQQTIERFGGTIDKVNQNLDEHTRLLRSISDRQDTTCRHSTPGRQS